MFYAKGEAVLTETSESRGSRAALPNDHALPSHTVPGRVVLAAIAAALAAFAMSACSTGSQAPSQVETSATAAAASSTAATTDASATQRAAYDVVLADYKRARDSGWSTGFSASTTAATGAEGLCIIVSTQAKSQVGLTYATVTSGTVSYAYQDLDGDGTPELAIGIVGQDGSYALVEACVTNGAGTVSSVVNSGFVARSHWYLLADGTVKSVSTSGSTSHSVNTFKVSGGVFAQVDAYSQEDTTYLRNGQAITSDEFAAAYNTTDQLVGLEWHPLSGFVASGSQGAGSTGATAATTSGATAATTSADDSAITENGYSFTIPSYWRGKVTVRKETDGSVSVVPTAYPAYPLCTFKNVSDQLHVTGGDYANPTVSSWQLKDGTYLMLTCSNYVFLGIEDSVETAANSPEEQRATALIDLQTGGTVTWRQALDAYMSLGNRAASPDMTTILKGSAWMMDNLASTVSVG